MKEELIKELAFCLELWENKGGCKFGKGNKCEQCAAPYLLLKLINNSYINNKRLTLADWKKELEKLK